MMYLVRNIFLVIPVDKLLGLFVYNGIFRHGDNKDRLTAPDSVEYVTNPPLLRYQNTLFYQIFYIACCCIR